MYLAEDRCRDSALHSSCSDTLSGLFSWMYRNCLLIPVSRRELDDIMTKITTKDDSKRSYGLIAFCLDNELHFLSDKREKQQQTDAI